jgi:hypothetical protein
VRTTLGDRREHPRFEVGGRLYGSLRFEAVAVVRNIATRGALIETSVSSPFKPVRAVRVTLDEGGPVLDAIVRHVTSSATAADPDDRCRVGLEFIKILPAALPDVERLLRDWLDNAR